ncbi:hypothetical protein Tco_1147880, partial [Tanacetum coccineum]
ASGGGAPVVVVLWCGAAVVDDPVTLTCRNLDDSQENCVLIHFMSCRQVERSPEDTVVVPLTYHVNGHYIEFGREEFCLITGLRFGPEFSDRYEVGPIPFRRLVFDSDKDGGHVNGQMLLDIINGEEFDNLNDEVDVAVCQLAILHFVLLDDKNGTWEIYPWGTLVWAQLYGQLENANVVRAEKLYAAQNRPIPRAAKYTLSGFTWAFKRITYRPLDIMHINNVIQDQLRGLELRHSNENFFVNINVPAMDFEDMVSYLTRKIPKRFTTLYYMLPSNHTLSGLKAIKNDYDTNVMYDIAKVAGKLQIYAAHHPIDLSTVLIPNDGSLEKSFAGIISEETILKLKESLRYLHQMQKQNKRFNYYELLGKPSKPYTQTIFNFLVHNNGQLVIGDKRNPVYVNGGTMNITIPRMKLQEMKKYLFNILGKNINSLYYTVPHNGFSITIKLRNNYDMHVMFDISSARGKLEIYIDHVGVNFIIHKYIYPNADLAQLMNHVITDYTSDSEEERKEVTQNDYTYDQMIEWAEQEHFEDEETKEAHYHTQIWKPLRQTLLKKLETELQAEVTLANKLSCELTRVAEQMHIREIHMAMLHAMPLTSLNSYGLHALLMTHESDIRITHNLRTTRDELLRSIAEKHF